jgi:hypothetical protein
MDITREELFTGLGADMKIVSFKYDDMLLTYNLDKPEFYHYDQESQAHCINYIAYDHWGSPYKVEWRIQGALEDKKESGREYAKRMSRFFDPWDVINLRQSLYDNEDEIC